MDVSKERGRSGSNSTSVDGSPTDSTESSKLVKSGDSFRRSDLNSRDLATLDKNCVDYCLYSISNTFKT